ncbi:MAG: MBOAT family O-acyltransferase, partial [Acidimicrobiia bacterium]
DSAVEALTSLGVDASGPTLRVILPVGISFYTFQTISYSFDVYRRRVEPTSNLVDFAVYVAYFPQLVAGPIERASRLLPLIAHPEHRHLPDRTGWARALSLVLTGLFKKVVIADGVGTYVTAVFDSPDDYSAVSVAAAVVGFAIQLYGDFSGYSDIARGVSELFGIELMVNFRQPYLSRNITEFWRRWHISLSDWLREYVYIPFGGNRGSQLATYRNLLLTMVLGGAWHGASWNFVIWGLLHGLALAAHRLLFGGRTATPDLAVSQVPSIVATFGVWCVSMVFFRVETLTDAAAVFVALTRVGSGTVAVDGIVTVVVLGTLTVLLDLAERRRTLHPELTPSDLAAPLRTGFAAGAMAMAILVFSGGTPTPFIYFQF